MKKKREKKGPRGLVRSHSRSVPFAGFENVFSLSFSLIGMGLDAVFFLLVFMTWKYKKRKEKLSERRREGLVRSNRSMNLVNDAGWIERE